MCAMKNSQRMSILVSQLQFDMRRKETSRNDIFAQVECNIVQGLTKNLFNGPKSHTLLPQILKEFCYLIGCSLR